MRDDALKALLEERWATAAAKYGERLLKDPDDAVARSNRAVALYEAGRWQEAARAFEGVLRREGPSSEVAPPALFSLGSCRLRLGELRGAVAASALFLELSDEQHPFFEEAVRNIASAAARLGKPALAQDAPKERILRAAFSLLGWRRRPSPRPEPSGRRARARGAPARPAKRAR